MPKHTSRPGVRIPKGRTKPEIFFTVNQRRYSWSLDLPITPSGLNDAFQIREERRERVLAGLPPIPVAVELGVSTDNPTVGDVSAAWIADLVNNGRAERTIATYQSHMDLYWLPHLGDQPIGKVKYGFLMGVDQQMNWSSMKNRNKVIQTLRTFFNFAYAGDFIDHNPVKFKKGRIQAAEVEAYTGDEAATLLTWLRENAPRHIYVYFHIGFDAGLRSAEILGLEWSHFDGEGLEIAQSNQRGKIKSTKTYETRWVPITDELADLLRTFRTEQMKEDFALGRGYIILNQYNRPYTRSDKINPWFHRACKETGVRDLMGRHSPYKWRHTFETLAYESGINTADTSAMMGHSIATGEKHYKARMSKGRLKNARRQMQQRTSNGQDERKEQ